MLKPIENKIKERPVTIQKKSLISKLNTTKKAIVASTPATGVSTSEVRTNARRESPRAVARRDMARRVMRRELARKN